MKKIKEYNSYLLYFDGLSKIDLINQEENTPVKYHKLFLKTVNEAKSL